MIRLLLKHVATLPCKVYDAFLTHSGPIFFAILYISRVVVSMM